MKLIPQHTWQKVEWQISVKQDVIDKFKIWEIQLLKNEYTYIPV